uniref:Bidirectional sugar transporter SWEET n=1 Tax=Salix viminalis TaxID=40686 RepID=A0A6N2KBY2_SALVM
MASISFLIGIIGNIISLLVFTSPIKTFWRVVKMKSTQNYKGAPYITTLLSTSLWTFYGLLKPAILIVTVNGAGAIFQLTYVTIFLVYATRDKKIKTARLVAILNVGFLGAVIAVTILAMHGGLRITFVGKLVIQTKSVEYMPFFLSFFLFLNGGVWSVYALLVKDYYIGVPNAFGFVLGSAQLILYMVYRKKAAAMIEEKGSVHIEAKDGVEIMPAKGDEEAGSLKNRSLADEKTKSLPKPSVDRQHSLKNLTKTLSLGAYELLQHSSWANDANISSSMATLSFFVGILGNIISLLVFVSPIKTFWGVVKKKSTENYKGAPYIITLLSTSLWTFYGIIKPDGLVVSIMMAKLVAILNVGFLGAVIVVALLAIHGNLRITFVGIICAALTIGMYAAPLSAMKRVVETKSVEYMPFLLSFFLFLNGGVWSVYSVLVKDFYIGVPNAVGFVLGSAQLILYLKYKNKSASAKTTTAMEEDGSVHRDKDDEDDGDDAGISKNRSLSEGKSLPKPSANREYSLQKIMKTLSLNDYELSCSSWANEAVVENGKPDNP